MNFEHVPVLLNECIGALNIKPNGKYIDGTLGGAGHSSEILKRLSSGGLLIGIDQDINAIETSRKRLEEIKGDASFIIEKTNFENINSVLLKHSLNKVDGILLDLGVSSHQLDEKERGFCYNQNAALDMRMNQDQELDAAYVVNNYSKEELAKINSDYGEERWAYRIADFIVKHRKDCEICTSEQLIEIIKAAIPASARRTGPHPAKRTFQAIRIEVNRELEVLQKSIDVMIDVLNPGGRLAIITFHSLEDRIVKNQFLKHSNPCTCPPEFPICVCGKKADVKIITKKPIISDENELEKNPRARSAKLRVIEKV